MQTQTKTYFATSVQAAMGRARQELGPDAMLVSSRVAPEEMRKLGRFEVVFAWELRALGNPGLDDIRRELSSVRTSIGQRSAGHAVRKPEVLAKPVSLGASHSAATHGAATHGPAIHGAEASLVAAGFELEMASLIVNAAAQKGQSVRNELVARIPVAPFVSPDSNESRIIAMFGPSGRGKTTSLVKIAIRFGLAAARPVRIYSAGSQGIGATEQMARYAAILGVPFQNLDSFDSLSLALQGDRSKGFILIDTPGVALADEKEMDAMTRFFARHSEIEKHLVLRADARSVDMKYMISRFAALRPSRLLFCGIDEARALGAAADAMIRSGIAASFLGSGPRIPQDLEELDAARLAESLMRPRQQGFVSSLAA